MQVLFGHLRRVISGVLIKGEAEVLSGIFSPIALFFDKYILLHCLKARRPSC
jgi:hypothetical protein